MIDGRRAARVRILVGAAAAVLGLVLAGTVVAPTSSVSAAASRPFMPHEHLAPVRKERHVRAPRHVVLSAAARRDRIRDGRGAIERRHRTLTHISVRVSTERTGGVRPAAVSTAPPFTECPAVGQDTSCELLIDYTGSEARVLQDASQGPYDGSDDTLVGIVNDSNSTVSALALASDRDIFGFDQDGICSGFNPAPSNCPFGPTGYEGPGTSFSGINSDATGGIVSFAPGVPPGGTAYFSLEDTLDTSTVFAGGPSAASAGGAPPTFQKITTCYAKLPVNCATGAFVHQFDDVAIKGRGVALQVQRTYSSSNASTDSPFGLGWSGSYDDHLTVDPSSGDVTYTDANGAQTVFAAQSGGTFTAPPWVTATLSAGANGTYVLLQRPSQIQTTYDSTGLPISETDRNGNVTTLTYSAGQLTTVTDPAGRSLTFAWSGNHISRVTDPAGRHHDYTYDSAGQLTSATDPLGNTWHFSYDSSHRLLTMTDPRGSVVTNVYDSSGRVTSQTDGAGLTTTWSYSGDPATSAGSTTTETDEHGNTTVYQYSDLELQSVTHAAGTAAAATTSYTYDPSTLGKATVTDPLGNVTTNSYDRDGNLTASTDPLDRTTFYVYDGADDLTQVQLPSGATTTYVYDSNGNVVSSQDPDGAVTTYTHGDTNHPEDVTQVTDPDGRVTSFTYDAPGDTLSRTVSPAPGTTNVADFGYDQDGEQVCAATARAVSSGSTCPASGASNVAGTTRTAYDADGHVTGSTDPLGDVTTYSYDANGNQTASTDALGRRSTSTFDGDNRAISATEAAGTSAAATTGHRYDVPTGAAGCTVAVLLATYCTIATDPNGAATSVYYDGRDDVVATVRPGSQMTLTARDLDGEVTTTTRPDGLVTTASYDNAQQPLGYAYQDATTPDVQYTYDSDGRRASMVDGTGTTTYAYDTAGRLTSATNGHGATVSYAYDLAGHVTSLTYPDGHVVTYAYDGVGRMSSLTDWLGGTTTYAYDADGDLVGSSYGNGDNASSAFDAAGRETSTSVTDHAAATLAAINYTRDADGNIVTETDGGALSGTSHYSYDARNQLATANGTNYSYDAGGNPTGLGGTTQQFTASGQVTSSGTDAFGYDANGNRIVHTPASGPTTRYTYDQANRLVHAYVGNGFAAVAPARITDTRAGSGYPNAGKTLKAGQTLVVQVSGRGGVAPGASAAVLDLTVTRTTSSGFLTAWPSGSTRPSASALTWKSGQTVSNLVDVALNASGQVSLYNSAGSTDVVVDVQGYQAVPSAAATGQYNGLTPVRICDTRKAGTGIAAQQCNASGAGKLGPKATRSITVAGLGGVPSSGATAAVVNLTVTNTTSSGFAVLWPSGGSRPAASDLTWTTGTTVSNRVVVPLGPDGKINLYNSAGSTDVLIDVVGYFAVTGSTYTPRTPVRICDTRTGSGIKPNPCNHNGAAASPLGTNAVLSLAVNGANGVPANATAVVLNVTATSTTATSYLTVYPDGSARPSTSDLNWAAGKSVSNLVVARVGPDGKIDFANRTGSVQVVVDLAGYYTSTPSAATSYTYDGDGLRASKTTVSTSSRFTWDTIGSVPVPLSDGTNSYLYGPDGGVDERITNGVATFFVRDALGSTRVLLGAGGPVTGTYTFSTYGLATHTGTATSDIQLAGQYFDAESALYYLINRYYDPVSAQFLSVDPLAAVTGSPYGYAHNDPTNASDPLGLFCVLGHNPNGRCRGSDVKNDLKTIGVVAAAVGVVAGAAALCAATACIGDLAVIGGATTLEGTLAAAETLSVVAGTVSRGALIAGIVADGAGAAIQCHETGLNSAGCLEGLVGVGLDVALPAGGHFINEFSLARPIYDLSTSAVGFLYALTGDRIFHADGATPC